MHTVTITDNDYSILERWRQKRTSLVLRMVDRYPDQVIWLADQIKNEKDADTLHSILNKFKLENIPEVD